VQDNVTRITGFEEVKSLAQEVMNVIEKKVGTNVYAGKYEEVRKRADTRRQERRMKKSLMVSLEQYVHLNR
jgi:hypothetical protein